MNIFKVINGKTILLTEHIKPLRKFFDNIEDSDCRSQYNVARATGYNWLRYNTETCPNSNISTRGQRSIELILKHISKVPINDTELPYLNMEISQLPDDIFVKRVWEEGKRRGIKISITT